MKYQYFHCDPADFASLYNPHRSDVELRQFLAFGIAVAGKTASTTAKGMDWFIEHTARRFNTLCPLYGALCEFNDAERHVPGRGVYELARSLANCGLGCQNQRARSFLDAYDKIVSGEVDLRTSSVSTLESILGVSHKTSRFFVLYSREGAQHAALDTHVWKMVRDHFPDAPEKVPGSQKKYQLWEQKFLSLRDTIPQFASMTCAELDFYGWDGKRKGLI